MSDLSNFVNEIQSMASSTAIPSVAIPSSVSPSAAVASNQKSVKIMIVSTHVNQVNGYSKVIFNLIQQLEKNPWIDIVHFGIVMIMGLMIGLITPPYGPSLFIISEVGKIPLTKLFSSILPFVVLLTISLLIVILLPDVIMWLPNLYFK